MAGFNEYDKTIFSQLTGEERNFIFGALIRENPDRAFSLMFPQQIGSFIANFEYWDIEDFNEEQIGVDIMVYDIGENVRTNLERFGQYFYPTLRERLDDIKYPDREMTDFYRQKVLPVLLNTDVCQAEKRNRQREVSEAVRPLLNGWNIQPSGNLTDTISEFSYGKRGKNGKHRKSRK